MAHQDTPPVIYRVQNDTGPDEEFTIRRKVVNENGNVIGFKVVDLTGYTVKLGIKSLTTNTITNVAHQTCTLNADPTTGLCAYRFMAGDLPDAGGDYECDLQLTDPAGRDETYYSKIRIRTRAEIVS